MKKFFSILLALLYLVTSNGFALQVHYCMDKISGLSLGGTEKKACGKCGMEKAPGNCCKDELKFVKLNDSHKLQLVDYTLQAPIQEMLPVYDFNFFQPVVVRSNMKLSCHAPPGALNTPRYIRHCVFRI